MSEWEARLYRRAKAAEARAEAAERRAEAAGETMDGIAENYWGQVAENERLRHILAAVEAKARAAAKQPGALLDPGRVLAILERGGE